MSHDDTPDADAISNDCLQVYADISTLNILCRAGSTTSNIPTGLEVLMRELEAGSPAALLLLLLRRGAALALLLLTGAAAAAAVAPCYAPAMAGAPAC